MDMKLTICLGSVGLGGWVYAHEVEQFVVVAWIHNNPAVRAEPQQQSISLIGDGLGDGVIQATLPRNQEPKSCLPGAKQFHFLDTRPRP